MSRSSHGTIGAILLSGVALSSQSQPTTPPPATSASAIARPLGLIVYAAKEQTPAQQSTDEQQCFDWAKTNTGIDPQQTTFKKAMGTCLQGRGYTTG
jgi:hypothetical protein